MDGKYYARMKSSLTRKRVLKDASFRRTREHAATLGEASKIASGVYRLIPKEHKKHALYREMTGKAIYLLRGRKNKETIFQRLCKEYVKTELPAVLVPAPKESLPIATRAQRHEESHYSNVREHITSDVRLPAPKLKKTYCGLPARAPTRARKSFADCKTEEDIF